MKTRLLNLLDDFRESFWFAPAMLSVILSTAAFFVLKLDATIDQAGMSSSWFVRNADAARLILTSIASTVMTLSGIVFSITLVAISMASSQFGSRLLRCFMVDSFADRVIGLLLGTSLFCYIVLNQVHGGETEDLTFVPQFSTAIAAILGLTSVAMLIWYVHDTSLSLQAPRLIATVATDLDEALERLFPSERDDLHDKNFRDDQLTAVRNENALTVYSACDGYVEGLDVESLVAIGNSNNGVVEVKHRPGHFVTTNTIIAKWHASNPPDDDTCEQIVESICGAFVIGLRRTPRQDITSSIIELVEVAVRALSPGVNNPFAAMNCIDRLSASLSRIASRPFPQGTRLDEDEQLRVILPVVDFPGLLHDAFAQIRQFGADSVAVAIRLIEAFTRIAEQTKCPENLNAIRQHAEATKAKFLASTPSDVDVADFNRRFETLQRQWT